jgi:hypothetical protein
VLMTYNEDFADIRELAGKHHSGIIRLRVSNQRAAAIDHIRGLDLCDSLVTVSDSRVRIRKTYSP